MENVVLSVHQRIGVKKKVLLNKSPPKQLPLVDNHFFFILRVNSYLSSHTMP